MVLSFPKVNDSGLALGRFVPLGDQWIPCIPPALERTRPIHRLLVGLNVCLSIRDFHCPGPRSGINTTPRNINHAHATSCTMGELAPCGGKHDSIRYPLREGERPPRLVARMNARAGYRHQSLPITGAVNPTDRRLFASRRESDDRKA